MTNFVNWLKLNQPKLDGFVPGQGNPAANHESPSTGVPTAVAPDGCNYAVAWADVKTSIQVSEITDHQGQAEDNNFTVAWPANVPFEIFNVIPGTTTIEMTDL